MVIRLKSFYRVLSIEEYWHLALEEIFDAIFNDWCLSCDCNVGFYTVVIQKEAYGTCHVGRKRKEMKPIKQVNLLKGSFFSWPIEFKKIVDLGFN
jgi:hypothetical protein